MVAVGIAATAFLFTLQPALAFIPPRTSPANNIFSRQMIKFNSSSTGIPLASTCQSSCQVLRTIFTNISCITTLQCLCTGSVADGLETCLQCVVSIGAFTKSDSNDNVNNFTEKCAKGGFPISTVSGGGGSSTATSTSSTGLTSSSTSTGHGATASGATSTGPGNTSTLSANLNEPATAAVNAPANTSSAASKMSISTFGVMITTVLTAITLLCE